MNLISTVGSGIDTMIGTTRSIAMILNPVGTSSARLAEKSLSSHLSKVRQQHTELDELISRINRTPEYPSVNSAPN